jgi:hypothetical protein
MRPFSDPAGIQLFNISGADVRFGQTEDGTPYSVAADFAMTMGYGQASDATRLLDDDEKGQQIVLTPGGPQKLNVIYEDGMWELIFRSSLPGAKAIKKRVKAILKQIRETGQYEVRDIPTIGPGTIPWDHAAAVARARGLHVDAHRFKELLTSGGVLTTRDGTPHKKWEHLFWPVPNARRWEVRSIVLPQLIAFADQVQRELALAERALQLALPFPVGGIVRGGSSGGAA